MRAAPATPKPRPKAIRPGMVPGLRPGATLPVIDRHTLMVVYTPQTDEAKSFFRQLRWVLEQKQVANQEVVLIEHTAAWLVESSPPLGN